MSDTQGTPAGTPPDGLSRLPARTQKGIDGIQKLMGKTPMELIPECPNTRWSMNLVEEFRSLVNVVKKQRNPTPYSFDEIKSFLLEKVQEHDLKKRTSLEASDVRAAKYHFFGGGQGAGEDNGDEDNAVPGLRNKRLTRESSAETIPQSATHSSPSTAEHPRDSITVDPQLNISAFGTSTASGVRADRVAIDSHKLMVASQVPRCSMSPIRDDEQSPEGPINDHTASTLPFPSSDERDFRTGLSNVIQQCETSVGFLIARAGREQASGAEQQQRNLNHARDIHKRHEGEVAKHNKTSAEAKDNLVRATKMLEVAEALFAALENAVGTLDAPPETYLAQVTHSRDKAIIKHDLASQRDNIEVKKLKKAKRNRAEVAQQVVDLQAELETQEDDQAKDAQAMVGAETLRKLPKLHVTDLKPLIDGFPGFMDAVDRMAENRKGKELGQ
ncbi:uncharacterized protein NECHADRAFT_89394 [Fusarium vanettenii 77-13-4]|uniref:Uncharacterized protein n=1 Tax=Fusarium vanettenii (strain ATCC MYA-4622 / CBS 123669 / FGSC 9596 / NRRL 45880 / 77-13-4) TaxID=660122 RepID=C7ZR31_FUSV7|nr:uncharacterized protein NECHADRAFT_89394 [Fusarium vanettenii 77-13-4]EEU33527.1 predicted protein [Fusarium vanettenii 77-13-4]